VGRMADVSGGGADDLVDAVLHGYATLLRGRQSFTAHGQSSSCFVSS